MPRTKVFYFIPNLQQGGVEGQILELINRLPPRFEPVLCVYHGDNVFWDKCPPGQPAHDLGVRRMNLGALDKLTDILLREKPAIVHSYRDKANFWARWAASRAGVPITITGVRNRMMALRYLATEWYLQRKSSVILANSIGVKHELVRWARVRDDKVRVIYNLLDVDFFRPPTAAERAEARARWQLAPDARALLLPGRMGIQKHQLGLLAAMRALARRGKWPKQAVVMFAGRARDKLTSALVRWFARQPELANAVRLLEAVKDIRSLYWASDLLVMPSLYEGLANAALEGCATGLPAILSHAANVDGIVRPGETGWEVATLRHAPLVRALDEALATPAERLAEMGRAGRAHVAERFAPRPDHVLDQMVAVYDELLSTVAAGATARAPAGIEIHTAERSG
ncbi:MAG TPA: glycosyltransferase [Polyangia bacterium]|jgi:glycosyltransferase involved in cell wall biosynthesis|nr:glycosyltransferase [Polyangia bacterium]